MLDFIKNLFGNKHERALKKLWPIVDEINAHYEEMATLTAGELREKTEEFKHRIQEATAEIDARRDEIDAQLRGLMAEADVGGDGAVASETLGLDERQQLVDELDDLDDAWYDVVEDVLDEIMPEAFAVVKATCEHMLGETWQAGGQEIEWGMVPYDVQLLGAIVLHQGKIAEMKTGEGKTLAAVMPVYLNALVGAGVHVITVNPYLAERDAEWMGPIYAFHGLTVDVVDRYQPHSKERRGAYQADITYGTNNEFGFDYLRDHSFVVDERQLVQRDHHYAIVDEIDSVLIDEARTPLIISGPVPQDRNNDQFDEFKPVVERVVHAQKKLVAELVKEGEALLDERDEAKAAGESKRAQQAEDQAGLLLFRATRGFPKNKKLQRLLQEPGVGRLVQRTESFYLRDSAKQMHIVDDELYFALEEKQHAIEMTDKGRALAAKAANEEISLFVLPDIGEESAQLEDERDEKLIEREEDLEARKDLDEEKRENKLMNDRRLIQKEFEEQKRELYNLYSERAERLHAIEQLLKAYTLYEKDKEYIVQEGKVQIVDKHTGRVLSGRRYSDGLHQAIEAKEGVEVQAATQTYATITLQNYFRMYHKLSGMTGTAETEAEEFDKIYKLEVVVIPTNEPVIRDDRDDLVFRTKREKYNAVQERVEGYQANGQPVLVGTASVEVSETLSRMFKRAGIKHNVLNARRDRAKQESLIVAEAGRPGAVTIATNMAGRGTDIKLAEGVREAGGLAIVGTERHESRRIDLQLRGRAGRQGDPGVSQFFVSLEDDLMRLFGSDRITKVMDKLDMEEGAVITHSWVTKSIGRAQKKVEQNNFAIRKRQLEYDDVLNNQRQVIYTRRKQALRGDRFHGKILDMLEEVVADIVNKHYGEGNLDELREELLRTLAFDLEMDRETFFGLGEDGVAQRIFEDAFDFYRRKREALARPFHRSIKQLVESDREDKPERIFVDFSDGRRALRAVTEVQDTLESQGQEVNDALERTAMLSMIDEHWTEHLRSLDEVKEGIGLRAYGRQDPLVAYKLEAFELFKQLMKRINHEVVSFVMRAGPLVEDRQRSADDKRIRRRLDPSRAQEQHESQEADYSVKMGQGDTRQSSAERDPSSGDGKPQPVVVEDEPGRNDKVTIRNTTTGDTAKLKYKYAKKKLDKGWSLITVHED